jgi:hypothetical protein
VVSSVDELYEAAEVERAELREALEALAAGYTGMELKLVPLKAREPALEKARGRWLCERRTGVEHKHRVMTTSDYWSRTPVESL